MQLNRLDSLNNLSLMSRQMSIKLHWKLIFGFSPPRFHFIYHLDNWFDQFPHLRQLLSQISINLEFELNEHGLIVLKLISNPLFQLYFLLTATQHFPCYPVELWFYTFQLSFFISKLLLLLLNFASKRLNPCLVSIRLLTHTFQCRSQVRYCHLMLNNCSVISKLIQSSLSALEQLLIMRDELSLFILYPKLIWFILFI